MRQSVIVLGTGHVGGELIRQIEEKDAPGLHTNPTIPVGLVTRDRFLFEPGGIIHPTRRLLGKTLQGPNILQHSGHYDEVFNAVDAAGLRGEAVWVDATTDASVDMLEVHKKIILEREERMVTINKNPLSLFKTKDFQELTTDQTRYRYSATVMAGAGAITKLLNAFSTSDGVSGVQGCFSGTLGYICSELQRGVKLSEAIQNAMDQHYTETRLWDDFSGLDVMRKLLILLRSNGLDVEKENILLEPFMPAKFGDIDTSEEFIATVAAELDDEFEQKVKEAKSRNMTLRYVASFTSAHNETSPASYSVRTEKVPIDSPLGMLKGTENYFGMLNQSGQNTPDGLSGRGAGLKRTAISARMDLLALLDNTDIFGLRLKTRQ